ncbi:AraC family transcriptional regulator N-terminal domain-containing protein [Lysobacter sp. CA199]|uniref:AraC family transcriptional regulator n=1 Tax=Lysobacter sp. CA199 TaxID=3455608 RepID=UPI003F8D4020
MNAAQRLAQAIDRNSGVDGLHPTALPRVQLIRASREVDAIHELHRPAVCIVAQGRKRVMLGDRIYEYDRNRYLVVSVDVPILGQIVEASVQQPYLCLRIDLDPALLSSLWLESGLAAPNGGAPGPSLMLSDASAELLDAAIRLLALLDTPDDIPMLAPMVERELLYRLMKGEQASRLHEIAHGDSRLRHVNRAIDWIKRHYREPFDMAELAAHASMSSSALHAHFKSVTRMSPLQYQKQLRLQQARGLMLGQSMDAASAGHAVGYDSPSQFSREYSRLFGAPPLRDVARLREMPPSFHGDSARAGEAAANT